MKRIYEAANSIEAHMIVHLLTEAGMEAHVQGEHLQSGAGDLPLGGLVGVTVADEDVVPARRLIKEWEALTPAPEPAQAQRARGLSGPLATFILGGLIGGGIVWSMDHGPADAVTPECPRPD
jgi:Putative prokaryotic signal transducing protein